MASEKKKGWEITDFHAQKKGGMEAAFGMTTRIKCSLARLKWLPFILCFFAVAIYFFLAGPPSSLYHLYPAAALEEEVVMKIASSLRHIGEEEYGVKPVASFTDPQIVTDYVRSFPDPHAFKDLLERAFRENWASYGKTLNLLAREDFDMLLSWEGFTMAILVTMPAKSVPADKLDTLFAGGELEDFLALQKVVDEYLCCMMLDDF